MGWWPSRKRPVLRKVSVGLPFKMGHAEWEVDDTEARAAWALYVELVTRITVEPLYSQEGLLREALTSLHEVFPRTRDILKAAGPSIAKGMPSVGSVSIEVLNRGLRPFLSKWHPELLHWESHRTPETSPRDHELEFPKREDLRTELRDLQRELRTYSEALGKIAGVSR